MTENPFPGSALQGPFDPVFLNRLLPLHRFGFKAEQKINLYLKYIGRKRRSDRKQYAPAVFLRCDYRNNTGDIK